MDLFATRNHRFQIGDRIMVVGPEDNVNRVSTLVGNSTRHLDTPNIVTIFIGIIVGIIFGSIPISLPSMPVPLKLGIAGGPLIISILIGRFGYKFKLVSYTTTSANMMLREIGLVLFLACVGIKAGAHFLGYSCTRRRIKICLHRLYYNYHSYPNHRNNCPDEIQI